MLFRFVALLALLCTPLTFAGEIRVGQPASGHLDSNDEELTSGEYLERHTFAGRAGETVTVTMTSGDLDTYLILKFPDGNQTTNDDGGDDGTNSQIVHTLTSDGTYEILATTYSVGDTGGYTVTLESDSPSRSGGGQSGSVSMGQTTSGTLRSSDPQRSTDEYFDPHTFSGQAGETVTITMTSGDVDTYLILRTPGGDEVINDDAEGTNSQIIHTLTESGTHEILASTFGSGETGGYELLVTTTGQSRASETETMSGSLTSGDPTMGDGKYVDEITLEGIAGDYATITLESATFDTYLILQTPSGDQIENDDAQGEDGTNSRIEITLRESGTYTISCSSYGQGMTGDYTLTVTTGDAPELFSPGRMYYGVFVGIGDYAPIGPDDGDLDLCRGDALKLSRTLQNLGIIEASNSHLLLDQEATRDNIVSTLESVAREIDDDDVFIFFYSGHGNQSDEDPNSDEADLCEEMLIAHDGRSITDDEMARLFDNINAEIAVLCLDSCFSGGFAKDVIVEPGRLGIFSSEEDLTSKVAGQFEAGGYLAHFLLEGINTFEADNDPEDGVMTVGELCHYLQVQYARHVVESVTTSTASRKHGYQNLVVDRGGVKIDSVLLVEPGM